MLPDPHHLCLQFSDGFRSQLHRRAEPVIDVLVAENEPRLLEHASDTDLGELIPKTDEQELFPVV